MGGRGRVGSVGGMCEEAGRRKPRHAMLCMCKVLCRFCVCMCNGMERSNLVEIEENIKGKQALS